ncbi:hypothetical protein TPHA_0B03320 [Tetrapisispora phaffii CBS 4417]|uniref:Helicase ATP-binding domain-containing protein n=1 Tax=Tetrapisispora phaffii (strain ATCC 24235 / CBS 4417 / NBRC 1672 / NRRL Y-8282 / UCD 70-5) TaxID=1071381 RepID=G8BPS3_TETPH|nr:hypothetical protein TPHA_0B03320 [Tetrapisispora phaffii CBS 4417]CCE62004.1 hypothetical protein TPHA_0B03320 [Tetrapisispora phaffii CBS 4417]
MSKQIGSNSRKPQQDMSKFQCLTCSQVLDAESMMKHLSSTRHKAITDILRDEDVSCEECSDSNIHQLQIIRFGGEDMALLCNTCFKKEYANENEKPNTCYSLSNGSILKSWSNYLKVRDCVCGNCGKESHLNVNSRKNVLCDQCLQKESVNRKTLLNDYISESSGRFLYLFLGIPETKKVNKVQKRKGRKMGRGKKKGRDKGKKGEGKPKKVLTVHEQMAKRAYETKKMNNIIESTNSISLDSFKGIRASSSSPTPSKLIPTSKSFGQSISSMSSSKSQTKPSTLRQNNNASTSSKRQSSANATIAKSSRNLKTSSNRSDKSHGVKTINSPAKKVNNTSARQERAEFRSKPDKKGNKNTSSNFTFKSHEDSNSVANGPKSVKLDNKSLPKKGDSNEKNKKYSNTKENDGKSTKNTGNRNQSEKIRDEISKRVTSNATKGNGNNSADKVKEAKKTNNSNNKVEEIEEGVPIKEFTKYIPQMTYADLESYFLNFSHALFLEQKLEADFIQNFEIIWPRKDTERVFVIHIKQNNNPEIEKMLSPTFAKLGVLPFINRQVIMLSNQEETQVWYCYVKEVASRRGNIQILLELFYWNNQKLPNTRRNEEFKILPCSAQTNRIMFAMTSIKNQRFVALLLGVKPVRQIDFKNRIQFSKETLNDSQKSAIQHVLNNSITILQGPPGTGKTSTIEEIILQMIKNFNSFPILCVAASNIAIDNIAEKLLESKPDIKILRILSEGKEQQYGKDHPLGKICLHNIVNDQLSENGIDTLIKVRSGRIKDVSKNQLNKLMTEQNNISDRYVSQAQILLTTNIAAGGRQLKSIKEVPVVIMDEATQSSEMSTLVPLSLPGIRTFVFVGDEKQLSSFSNVPQLEMSLFERILLNGSYKNPHMLDTQYRMHPQISRFPIEKFYDNKLLDGVTEEQKKWPGIEHPLYFHQCDKGLENKVFNYNRGSRGFTYTNKHEVKEIVKFIYRLILEKNVPRTEIGIITPYSAQRDLISETLQKDLVVNPERLEMEREVDDLDLLNSRLRAKTSGLSNDGNKVNTINIINGVFISTIDSFQGHEKGFIIFSCVRNNKENKIGFVSDKRRMNVALTRAKHGLIMIGNKNILKKDTKLWASYIDYLEKHNLIHTNLDEY